MAQIKTVDDLINCEPKLKLGELIQLFLRGYDDKIYINLYHRTYEKCSIYTEDLFECIRIIDPFLIPFYDCYIERLEDPCDNNVLLTIVINTEAADE